MSRASHAHADYAAKPVDQGVAGLGLFAESVPAVPSWAEVWSTLAPEVRKYHRDRWKQLLLPVVLELAARPLGVTASEVLTEGAARSFVWTDRAVGSKYPRIYAWVGPWLSELATKGQLVARTVDLPEGGTLHVTRESERIGSHGNRNGVYVLGAAGRGGAG